MATLKQLFGIAKKHIEALYFEVMDELLDEFEDEIPPLSLRQEHWEDSVEHVKDHTKKLITKLPSASLSVRPSFLISRKEATKWLMDNLDEFDEQFTKHQLKGHTTAQGNQDNKKAVPLDIDISNERVFNHLKGVGMAKARELDSSVLNTVKMLNHFSPPSLHFFIPSVRVPSN
jgi:hypothetical protein